MRVAADHGGNRPAFQRLRYEVMPVEAVALDGDEESIHANLARIDRDRAHTIRGQPTPLAASGVEDFANREKFRHYDALSASSTTSWSEK